jgi:hypothetical protein
VDRPRHREHTGALRRFRQRLGAVGGWVLADARDPPIPVDRNQLSRCLKTAEKDAGLPKLDGGLWHPYRRKWATERKQQPVTDVAAAGRWQNTTTLMTCNQQPTNDALVAVMNEPWKVRDVAVHQG